MSLTSLGGLGKELGARFSLVGVVPVQVLVLAVLALVGSGAPERAPQLRRIVDAVEGLGAAETALLIFAILALSLILQPLQLPWSGCWRATGVVPDLLEFSALRAERVTCGGGGLWRRLARPA
jgi:hypothetical protein